MSRPDRSKGNKDRTRFETNPPQGGNVQRGDVKDFGAQRQKRRSVSVTIFDERLSSLSTSLLGSQIPPLEISENPNAQKVVRIYPIDVPDPRLDHIIQQRLVPRVERRNVSPGDRLRAFTVKGIVWTFIVSVILLLAIVVAFAVKSNNVVDAAGPLGKVLESAGGFLKVVFGGSILALVVLALFNLRPPRTPRRRDEDRISSGDEKRSPTSVDLM